MRRLALALVVVLSAGAHHAAACSYCGDPDLVPGGPPGGAGPFLSQEDIDQGFYVVTKAYTGDSVTVTGNLTRYSFQTNDVTTPTSVARDVSVVQSGQRSPFDGTSANPRPTLKDGRPVGGTYVDSFQIDASGNKVFIQRTFLADDSELAKDAARITTPPVAPAEVTVPKPVAAPVPDAPRPPAPSSPDTGTPTDLPDTDGPEPGVVGTEPPAPREPERRPTELDEDVPSSPRAPAPPAPGTADVRAGVALAPQADVLPRIEILRGRRVSLWIRATVDGSPSRVRSWRLISGEVAALGAIAGSGDDPFVAQWLEVGRAADPFVIRFEAVVETRGGTVRSAHASISVTVRSPAVIE